MVCEVQGFCCSLAVIQVGEDAMAPQEAQHGVCFRELMASRIEVLLDVLGRPSRGAVRYWEVIRSGVLILQMHAGDEGNNISVGTTALSWYAAGA